MLEMSDQYSVMIHRHHRLAGTGASVAPAIEYIACAAVAVTVISELAGWG